MSDRWSRVISILKTRGYDGDKANEALRNAIEDMVGFGRDTPEAEIADTVVRLFPPAPKSTVKFGPTTQTVSTERHTPLCVDGNPYSHAHHLEEPGTMVIPVEGGPSLPHVEVAHFTPEQMLFRNQSWPHGAWIWQYDNLKDRYIIRTEHGAFVAEVGPTLAARWIVDTYNNVRKK